MKLKTKAIILLILVSTVLGGGYMLLTRAMTFYDTFWFERDVGRETKFNFLSNTCVVDSGRKDADGNTMWVHCANDRGFGE